MVKGQGYQESLEHRVLCSIREHHLVEAQRQLLVAVSGGQDSVCLLHILVKLQEELKVELHVAHLDHRLRGAESEADARYVYHLSQQLGIPATIEQRDVKAYRAQQHTSLEESAREVRYTFLAEVARSIGANRVAVGHTTDDHVETILMHLVRGTGTRGLRGLQPTSQWQSSGGSLTIIRPLLTVSRQETADYCHNHQLMPRMDTSNLSLSPLRNRIRHQLLPLLRSYNPRVADALLRTARIAGDDLAFLDRESARLWRRITQRQGDTIILDRERFLELPSALQRHLLRVAIGSLLGSLKDIEARHIEEIMSALTKAAGKKLSLPGGLVFDIGYNQYRLGLDAVALSPFSILGNEFVLKVPGETLLPGWRVAATIVRPPMVKGGSEVAPVPSGNTISPPLDRVKAVNYARLCPEGRKPRGNSNRVKETGPDADNFIAYFDLNNVGSKVVVRCRKPGDRFQPLGMSQPKKLGEFMIDAKIPRAWRQQVPVVCSLQHIMWVVGWRIDDRVKVTDNTRQVLCLVFNRNSTAIQ